ncbi:MAG: lipoyl synthase [Candidatus Omnitrophota bacterium]
MYTPTKPSWIRRKVTRNKPSGEVGSVLRALKLNSVCEHAACPNISECWGNKDVTFMILGNICTRGCRFCNIDPDDVLPATPDSDEPRRIAEAVKKLGMRHVVVTSVTRDDLEDKGSEYFLNTVREIKHAAPEAGVELLIPDLGGDRELLERIAFSGADIIGHNIEMPRVMYPAVRPRSDYEVSMKTLGTLSSMKKTGANILVKSSMILGLGEEEGDISRTLKDLKNAGVDILYLGQYLAPSRMHWPVKRYYRPEEFTSFEKEARATGFPAVLAAPFVRSSYRAAETLRGHVIWGHP